MIRSLVVVLLGFALWLAYRWVAGKKRKRQVEHAIQAVRPMLLGERGEHDESLVAEVFWYGAVDIAPKHLIVWVLLKDELGSKVPPWFVFDDTDKHQKMAAEMDDSVLEKLRRMRQAILEALRTSGWAIATPDVGFEWEQRVKEGGGFFYFK